MKIIFRYLSKEITMTMVAVTLILLSIFMCNNIVRYLGLIARGKYAFWMLLHLILLQIPITLGLLLPLGLYIGILLAYGRMYVDSEMTVLSACGFSRKQLLSVTLSFAFLVMLLTAFFSIWVLPSMELRIHQVMTEAKAGSILDTIMPGRFQVVRRNDTEQVYYVEKISRGHKHVSQVFSAERSTVKQAPWEVIAANKGVDRPDKKTGDDYFVMQDGELYKGVPGEASFQVVDYKNYGLRAARADLQGLTDKPDLMAIQTLLFLAPSNPAVMAELQWRISIPIAVLLLAYLALPLSRIRPRQGRYAKFLPAILIFIVYFNLLMLARGWVASQVLPAWFGMWWVHVLLLVLAIGLNRSQGSWRIWRRVDVV